MTARLDRDGSPARALRDILHEQVRDAFDALAGQRISDHAVHEARQGIKKARATLRLLRDAISDEEYRRENAVLRDAAQPLSGRRDATVLIDTLRRMVKAGGGGRIRNSTRAFGLALKQERQQATRASRARAGGIVSARNALRLQRTRVSRLALTGGKWSIIEAALRRVYANGRRCMREARRQPIAENLHEWRKQVKYLRYELRLLEPAWPGVIGELVDQAHHLSDYLGDDHDLAVLRRKVKDYAKELTETNGVEDVVPVIDRCRERLQTKALVLGARVYEERPRRFVARIGRYWHEWRQDSAVR